MDNQSFHSLLNSDKVQKIFTDVLGKDTTAFISDLRTVFNGNDYLKKCDPMSIISAGMHAAKLRLSINPHLGQAYIVPSKGNATFQIGSRGWMQLAHRTGKYVRLHANKVFEGQIKEIDCITGDVIRGEKLSDKVVGYIAYMRLTNGFENTLFMTTDEMDKHAEKYSPAYVYDKRNNSKKSPWSTDFDSMAYKTVLKKLLKTSGYISSTVLETAIKFDQTDVNAELTNPASQIIDEAQDVVTQQALKDNAELEPTHSANDPF